ncbi:MAG: hypothetical protein SVS15_00890 [Thermodesulfobacteriota bacterium]|nr:hypothetical protein [Thermodesulfobacteriota bacterium]
MIEVLIWIIALIILTGSFVYRKNDIFVSLVYALTLFIFSYGIYLLIKNSALNIPADYPLRFLPLSIHILFLLLSLRLIHFIIITEQVTKYMEYLFDPIVLILFSFGFFLGPIIFPVYSRTQWSTSALFFFYAVASYITSKYKKRILFEYMSLLLVAITVSYYLFSVYIEYGELSNIVDYLVLNSFGITFLFIYFIVNFKIFEYSYIKNLNRENVFKTYLCIIMLNFAYRHPEIKNLNIPLLNKIFKYSIASGDFGIMATCIGTIFYNRKK